jgi:hypothetical protein
MRNESYGLNREEKKEGEGTGQEIREGKERKNRRMKAIFWNVAGVKSLKEEDWKFLKEHEIIGLTETWEEEGKASSQKHLADYEVKYKYAEREKKKGRARGGILLAFKKSKDRKIEWEKEETKEAIAARWEANGEKWLWGINYMRRTKEENYEVMSKWVEKEKEGVVIICGDFNARTAKEGGLWDSAGEREERESKDEKYNEEGKEMVRCPIEKKHAIPPRIFVT